MRGTMRASGGFDQTSTETDESEPIDGQGARR